MAAHEFVISLRKLTEENHEDLVRKGVDEVKEQLEARAKQGFDSHQVTLPSDRIAKGVVTHLLSIEGLKVEYKNRTISLSW